MHRLGLLALWLAPSLVHAAPERPVLVLSPRVEGAPLLPTALDGVTAAVKRHLGRQGWAPVSERATTVAVKSGRMTEKGPQCAVRPRLREALRRAFVGVPVAETTLRCQGQTCSVSVMIQPSSEDAKNRPPLASWTRSVRRPDQMKAWLRAIKSLQKPDQPTTALGVYPVSELKYEVAPPVRLTDILVWDEADQEVPVTFDKQQNGLEKCMMDNFRFAPTGHAVLDVDRKGVVRACHIYGDQPGLFEDVFACQCGVLGKVTLARTKKNRRMTFRLQPEKKTSYSIEGKPWFAAMFFKPETLTARLVETASQIEPPLTECFTEPGPQVVVFRADLLPNGQVDNLNPTEAIPSARTQCLTKKLQKLAFGCTGETAPIGIELRIQGGRGALKLAGPP